jgi:uncharacterized membrane protein YhaH (DUF805 family)
MNLRWLTVGLRVAGLVLIVCAAVIVVRDSASLRGETQTSSDGYQIHHTAALSQSAIISGVVGAALFATSLSIRSKRLRDTGDLTKRSSEPLAILFPYSR